MRWLPKQLLLGMLLVGACLSNTLPAGADPNVTAKPTVATAPLPNVTPKPAAAASPLPNYGGRDEPSALTFVGTDAPNPLAQVGRSVFALCLVLGSVVGVVFLLKRAGYAGGPVGAALALGLRRTAPASVSVPSVQAGALSLLQSQSLPGGGAVHLLSVNEKTLVLVGATGQSVALLAEWEQDDDSSSAPNEFADQLARLDAAFVPPTVAASSLNGAVSDVLANPRPLPASEKH